MSMWPPYPPAAVCPPFHYGLNQPDIMGAPFAQPFLDSRTVPPPPWQRGENWRLHANPYSNHELYRQQYSQIPPARGHPLPPTFSRPYQPPMENNRVAMPMSVPEYASQQTHADYDRQLRELYQTEDNYCDLSETNKAEPDKMGLRLETSAKKIRFCWKLPNLPGNDDKFKIRLIVQLEQLEGGIGRGAKTGELGIILDRILPIHQIRTEFDTIPGSLYSIDLAVVSQKGEILTSTQRTQRAIFSMDEMKVLMQRAINFTGNKMQSFNVIYRCKPRVYWDYVYQHSGQVMQPYEKDSNGQAASPINQSIKGLFFSAKTNKDGTLPDSSPFGEIRMILPSYTLLDPLKMNLYFADFYCNSVPHYVTVVVCFKGGPVDKFCGKYLIRLNPFDNQFLLFTPTSNPNCPFYNSVSKNIWVEIYYTSDVPMSWGCFDKITARGAGTSKIGGLPHNKSCLKCNLYPSGLKMPQPPINAGTIPANEANRMVREANQAALVDDEDGDLDEQFHGDQDQPGTAGLYTYEQLKERLKQLDESIFEDLGNQRRKYEGKGIDHFEDMFRGLSQRILNFVTEAHTDFVALDENVTSLERAARKEKGVLAEGNAISGTLDALLDRIVTGMEPGRSRFRTRRSSGDSPVGGKRSREFH